MSAALPNLGKLNLVSSSAGAPARGISRNDPTVTGGLSGSNADLSEGSVSIWPNATAERRGSEIGPMPTASGKLGKLNSV